MQIPLINKKNSRQWLIGVLAVGVIGTSAIAYQTVTRNSAKPNIVDLTVPVEAKSLQVRIKASGSVVPIQAVNVSPKVSGRLVQLYVEQGDRVTKGQIIARMDDESVQAQLQQVRASLVSAQANLEKLRNGSRDEDVAAAQARVEAALSRANLSSTRLNRYRNLAIQGAITQDRLDELNTDDRSARANLQEARRQLEQLQNGARIEDIAQAEAQVAEADARVRSAAIQVEDTIIYAPFSGIVTQKFTNVGAFVTPTTSASSTSSATSTSIVAVANGLEILAKVPEVDIGQIKVGQMVEVVADAYSDKVFQGRVRLIAPEAVLEQNVTSFQVRVSLETGQKELQSGMNTDLRFIGQKISDALVVPTVAIVTENGETGVLVPDENNKAKFRPITIGTTIENQTQILNGVNSGERVFVKQPDSKSNKP